MQKVMLFFCLLAVSLIACQSESSDSSASTNSGISTTTEDVGQDYASGSDVDPFPTSKGSPQQQRIKEVLATNFWITTGYFKTNTKGVNKQNQGNWYQFKPDGTFVFGHFEKELAKGAWDFNYKGKRGQVEIKAEDPKYSGLWNLKMGNDESLMIWVGTEVYKTNGVQQRLENLLFIPKNRAELGMKD